MKKNKIMFFKNTWKAISFIGEGSYGKVYKAINIKGKNSEVCAIKNIFVYKNKQEIDTLIREGLSKEEIQEELNDVLNGCIEEINLMQQLKNSKNVVQIYDYEVIKQKNGIGWEINIRMELLSGLDSYFLDKNVTNHDIMKIGLDISNALRDCDKLKIIHRDIKPDNIFVDSYGNFKLGDFGIARNLEKTTTGLSQKGTYNYIAPEVYKGDKYNKTVDVYSLGIVLYKYFNYNRLPFLPNYPDKIMIDDRDNAIIKRISGEKIPSPLNASENESKIILKMISYNPNDRYKSFNKLIESIENVLLDEERMLPVIEKNNINEDFSLSLSNSVEDKKILFNYKKILLSVMFLVICLISFSVYFKSNFVYVPNLINHSSSEVISELSELDLNCDVKYKVVSNKSRIGKVIEQGYSKFFLKKNSNISLVVGIGSEKVKVPSVVGLGVSEGKDILEKLGFGVSYSYKKSDSEKNLIISQMIDAGTKISKGKTIELLVSLGSDDSLKSDDNFSDDGNSVDDIEDKVNSNWSGWVESLPSDINSNKYNIQSKVQYSARYKETTSSFDENLSGWTLYNKEAVSTIGTNTYAKARIKASEKENYSHVSGIVAYYNYVHCFITFSSGISGGVKPNSDGSCPSGYTRHVHLSNSGIVYCSSINSNLTADTVYREPDPVEYDITYEIVKTNYKYYYYRWSNWSNYQDSLISASDDKEVRTRTVYRYKEK